MLTEAKLKEIVKKALREQYPNQYDQLKVAGELDLLTELRTEAAMETRDWLMERARDEALTSNLEVMERVRRQMMRNRQADEIAIAQATEFEKF